MSKPKFCADHTYDLVRLTEAWGVKITRVHDAEDSFRAYPVKVKIPDGRLTFDLKFGKRHLLCLDDYGADFINDHPALEERLVGKDAMDAGWLIAIDLETGYLWTVTIQRNAKGTYAAVISRFMSEHFEDSGSANKDDRMHRVPKRYLKKQVNELRNRKRPWSVTFTPTALAGFHDRSFNWSELLQNAVVQLDMFDRHRTLELWCNYSRVVSNWEG